MSGEEIIGLADNVIRIADLGTRISVKLYTFTRKVKNSNKSIDALSQDIAAHGAVLQQLGRALEKDRSLQVCSQAAIDTATNLVNDTKQVFESLEALISSDETSNSKFLKGITARQKLKFLSLEPKIQEVQVNIERLKSSLLVILNVLILAEQYRNHEALPILKEQRELIRILHAEKDENEKRYEKILKAIADKSDGHQYGYVNISGDARVVLGNHYESSVVATTSSCENATIEPSGSSLSTASTVVADDTASFVTTDLRRLDKDETVLPCIDLPPGLKNHHARIYHHTHLVQNLLREISSLRYTIDHGTRDRMHNGVLHIHWDEWASQRKLYAQEHFEKIFVDHIDVARYWTDKFYSGDDNTTHSNGNQEQVVPRTREAELAKQCERYATAIQRLKQEYMKLREQFFVSQTKIARNTAHLEDTGHEVIRDHPFSSSGPSPTRSGSATASVPAPQPLPRMQRQGPPAIAGQRMSRQFPAPIPQIKVDFFSFENSQNADRPAQETTAQTELEIQAHPRSVTNGFLWAKGSMQARAHAQSQLQMAQFQFQSGPMQSQMRSQMRSRMQAQMQARPDIVPTAPFPGVAGAVAMSMEEGPMRENQLRIDLGKQCGVTLPTGEQCTRSLTCRSHSITQKRSVPGRRFPYDMLPAAFQRKNQAWQQAGAASKSATVPAFAAALDSTTDFGLSIDEPDNRRPKDYSNRPVEFASAFKQNAPLEEEALTTALILAPTPGVPDQATRPRSQQPSYSLANFSKSDLSALAGRDIQGLAKAMHIRRLHSRGLSMVDVRAEVKKSLTTKDSSSPSFEVTRAQCSLCRHRKIRCDGLPPHSCINCEEAATDCTYDENSLAGPISEKQLKDIQGEAEKFHLQPFRALRHRNDGKSYFVPPPDASGLSSGWLTRKGGSPILRSYTVMDSPEIKAISRMDMTLTKPLEQVNEPLSPIIIPTIPEDISIESAPEDMQLGSDAGWSVLSQGAEMDQLDLDAYVSQRADTKEFLPSNEHQVGKVSDTYVQQTEDADPATAVVPEHDRPRDKGSGASDASAISESAMQVEKAKYVPRKRPREASSVEEASTQEKRVKAEMNGPQSADKQDHTVLSDSANPVISVDIRAAARGIAIPSIFDRPPSHVWPAQNNIDAFEPIAVNDFGDASHDFLSREIDLFFPDIPPLPTHEAQDLLARSRALTDSVNIWDQGQSIKSFGTNNIDTRDSSAEGALEKKPPEGDAVFHGKVDQVSGEREGFTATSTDVDMKSSPGQLNGAETTFIDKVRLPPPLQQISAPHLPTSPFEKPPYPSFSAPAMRGPVPSNIVNSESKVSLAANLQEPVRPREAFSSSHAAMFHMSSSSQGEMGMKGRDEILEDDQKMLMQLRWQNNSRKMGMRQEQPKDSSSITKRQYAGITGHSALPAVNMGFHGTIDSVADKTAGATMTSSSQEAGATDETIFGRSIRRVRSKSNIDNALERHDDFNFGHFKIAGVIRSSSESVPQEVQTHELASSQIRFSDVMLGAPAADSAFRDTSLDDSQPDLDFSFDGFSFDNFDDFDEIEAESDSGLNAWSATWDFGPIGKNEKKDETAESGSNNAWGMGGFKNKNKDTTSSFDVGDFEPGRSVPKTAEENEQDKLEAVLAREVEAAGEARDTDGNTGPDSGESKEAAGIDIVDQLMLRLTTLRSNELITIAL